jgi:hypothetical protein
MIFSAKVRPPFQAKELCFSLAQLDFGGFYIPAHSLVLFRVASR